MTPAIVGRSSAFAALRGAYTIWLRDLKTFFRDRSRIVGMIGQPLLYLLVLGKGISSTMTLRGTADIDYLRFMYPGIIGMSVLFTSIFSAMSIIWDREFGFLKEVLVAPVPRWAVALGKIMGGASVAVVQSAILLVLAPLVGVTLTVPVLAGMLAVSFLISFAMTALGVMIAAGMESMQGFQMVMNFLVMPLYFLSGAMFPMSTAPAWMSGLMAVDPLTYGVDALRTLIFSATVVQAGGSAHTLTEVARTAGIIRWSMGLDLSVLAAAGAVLAAGAAVRFNRTE